eukprot:gene23052-20568_t
MTEILARGLGSAPWLNGSVGRVYDASALKRALAAPEHERVPVLLDGEQGWKALKGKNVTVLRCPTKQSFQVGVGRPDLRTHTYRMALTYRKRSGDVVTRLPVPEGDNARWRGNIIGVDAVLTRFGNGKANIIVDVTDLNVARVVNRVAVDPTLQLPELDADADLKLLLDRLRIIARLG